MHIARDTLPFSTYLDSNNLNLKIHEFVDESILFGG